MSHEIDPAKALHFVEEDLKDFELEYYTAPRDDEERERGSVVVIKEMNIEPFEVLLNLRRDFYDHLDRRGITSRYQRHEDPFVADRNEYSAAGRDEEQPLAA